MSETPVKVILESGFDLPYRLKFVALDLTTGDALDILHATAPEWTFGATKSAWHHGWLAGDEARRADYSVSAQKPQGAGCEIFTGSTLRSAVDQCLAKLFPKPEVNNE